ncbi:MAG: L,D-transpeptidase family protein [Bacteroidales bacterium]|nr:L,D-transpeptidase family protein [Bacteroidales bacterium]
MKTRKKIVAGSLVLFLIVLGLGGYITYKYLNNKSPEKEIKKAIEALASVKKAQANKFAIEKYNEAVLAFEQAMDEWKKQNNLFFLNRDYSRVRALANHTVELCKESISTGSSEKKSLHYQLKNQLAAVEKKLNLFDKYYKNLPLDKSTFQQFSKARLKYDEALNSYKKEEVHASEVLAKEAESLIVKASAKAKEVLVSFYREYPTWEKNARLASKLSSKRKIVILINKLESTCSVLKSGKTIHTFQAELGQNWLGDKVRMGDKATPEGVYKVLRRKSGKETKFYKSLLINYPNDEDKVRFKKLLADKKIPGNSRIGNLIEIHGNGGKGVHWTDGCIALSDNDMDKIYKLCKVDTPVIIIGSDKPMNEYFK